jgi:PPOX class probable FMN-dependent enzyme
MRPRPGMREIRTAEELEAYGVPAPMNRDKVLTQLEDVHIEWLAATPLAFVATSSPAGRCDVSPKGDPAGFIRVLDPTTLLIPERAGNRRMDGFHNLLGNPHVGILCVIPGRGDTLRVNGSAALVADPPQADAMVVRRHRPALALLVEVEEVFFHCPKAFRRAKAWDPHTWAPDDARPYAEIALALWRRGESRESVLAHYEEHVYNESLYPPEPTSNESCAAPSTGSAQRDSSSPAHNAPNF